MEIIDKETFWKTIQAEINKPRNQGLSIVLSAFFIDLLEKQESIYLKQIEEIDREIIEWDAETARCISRIESLKQEHAKSCDDFGEFREKLQQELQEAKELLQSVVKSIQTLHGTVELINKIEKFLNK